MANDYLERLHSEFKDLSEKINKLKLFLEKIKSGHDANITDDYDTLFEQYIYMCRYQDILHYRLQKHGWGEE